VWRKQSAVGELTDLDSEGVVIEDIIVEHDSPTISDCFAGATKA
jgi:hypothetical protein